MPKPVKKATKRTSKPTSEWTQPTSQEAAWAHVRKVYQSAPSKDPVTRARQLHVEQMDRAGERHVKQRLLVTATITPGEITINDVVISPKQVSAYMAKMGAKGGKISGAKRMQNLSDRQRSAIAKKGAAARWKKKSES